MDLNWTDFPNLKEVLDLLVEGKLGMGGDGTHYVNIQAGMIVYVYELSLIGFVRSYENYQK